MKQFTDSQKRTWEISVTAGSVARVKDVLSISLPGLFSDRLKGYLEFLGDTVLQANVFWQLVKRQADEKKVTEEDFKDALDGDAMEGAEAALRQEIIDFFPKAQREPLRKMFKTLQTIGEQALATGMEKMEALNEEQIGEFLKTMEKNLSDSFGGPPEFSELTQDHSVSAG